jgi:seryl-tRNA synthetase
MLDLRYVRADPETVRADLRKRGLTAKIAWVDEVIQFDAQWRRLLTELNELRRIRNRLTEEVAVLKKEGTDFTAKVEEADGIASRIASLSRHVRDSRERLDFLLMRLPNVMHSTVPLGKDEADNVEIRRWGTPPDLVFQPRDHIDISLDLGLVDLERAAKVAGSRFYYLKNDMVLLNHALIRYGLDFARERGFILLQPPYALRRKAMDGAVSLTDFEEMLYKLEGEDLYLIATSEHAMVAFHMDELLDGASLPLHYCGVSPNFRREAGAHGRDTKGIFRTHQFEKVEQVVFCTPEASWNEHEALIRNAEQFYQDLCLPYRVVNVCSGDLGTVAAKKYDLEVWLPGQNRYREVVSCSNCTTYQAVRSRIRYRADPTSPTAFVHTLNSTLVATERCIIAILENYQRGDGTVAIPEVLVPYMNGQEQIAPPFRS